MTVLIRGKRATDRGDFDGSADAGCECYPRLQEGKLLLYWGRKERNKSQLTIGQLN